MLHDGDLLDNFLEVGVDGHLFDGQDLTRLLVEGFVDTAIRPVGGGRSWLQFFKALPCGL